MKGLFKLKKFYAANNESIYTALAEFETEQDRQDWLDYNTEYDKMYNVKSANSQRVPIDDEAVIASLIANPLITYCNDECIDGVKWYIKVQ